MTQVPADPCIVCGSQTSEQLYASTYGGSVAGAEDYFLAHRTATAHGAIRKCADCGFVFTSPRFRDEEYDTIYRNINATREIMAQFDAANTARFKRLARYVRQYVPAGSRLADFGCGNGAFLHQLDDPAAIGFEIGVGEPQMVGRSELVLGNWADVAGTEKFPKGGFKAVTAFDVFEHLPRLAEDVALVRSLLEPGGYLFASVPNVASFIAKAMGERWNMILLEHLWYFSPETFDRFLKPFGMERVAIVGVPFDASLAHLASRLSQTFGMKGTFSPNAITRLVLPVPAGIMLGIYRAV